MVKVIRQKRVCKVCGWEWWPRREWTVKCPYCQSYSWNEDSKDSEDKTSEFKKYLLTKTPEERELIRKLIDDVVGNL